MQGLTLVVVVLLFVAAELTRTSHVIAATQLSMAGWLLFALFAIRATGMGPDWRATLRGLAWVLVMSLAVTGVLLAFLFHSGVLEAGPHIDAAYTYLGLEWFLARRSPITMAGRTPSYHQYAASLLSHLPAVPIGVGRIGSLAVHLGLLVQIAVLIAWMARRLQPGQPAVQLLTAVLVAGVFSNRALVISYDKVGYTMPAVCLGLMLITVAAARSPADAERPVGMLLVLALLHHYSAIFFGLPLCLAWLLGGRRPLRRVRSFVARNPTLLLAFAIILVTIVIHPDLLLRRVWDVTTQARTDATTALLGKVRSAIPYLVGAYPHIWYAYYVRGVAPTWHLLTVPPLGGLVLPIVVLGWILSWWAMAGRRRRTMLLYLSFAALLVLLSAVQHLVTDFEERREITAVYAVMVAGLLFVFRALALAGRSRVLAVVVALAICVYNYTDVSRLRGLRFGGPKDRGYVSQHTMDVLRSFLGRHDAGALGIRSAWVVSETVFPLEALYVRGLERRYGLRVRVVRASLLCFDEAGAITRLLFQDCESLLLVSNERHCRYGPWEDAWGVGRVTAVRYPAVCGEPTARWASRQGEPFDLER